MVISYDKQFLFLHVPKTGGLSMTEVLQGYQHDPDQYVTNRLLARVGIRVNHFLFSYRQRKFRRHTAAWQVQRWLPRPVFRGLFKFAFIRNPWDLLVSYHKFVMARPKHHRYARIKEMDFHNYIRFAVAKKVGFQKAFLSDSKGHLLVDYVGRFERMQHDFGEVLGYLGIDAKLPHLNRSQRADYRRYYDRRTRNLVKHLYRDDIDQFGYEF
jgi:hypothetical protein